MYPITLISASLKRYFAKFSALLALLLLSFNLQANEFNRGDITIYYNALSSASIPAEVAAQYGITRSGRTGLVNISVARSGKAIFANIFGQGQNLTGQLKKLAFKEIKEGDAIYYIAVFNFNNAENLTFDLQVQPEKQGQLIPLKFKQQLFRD